MQHPPRRALRGVTLSELLMAAATLSVMAMLAVPALGAMRGQDRIGRSLDNLRLLSAAHVAYSVDFDDRQWTAIKDGISVFGDDAQIAFAQYNGALPGIFQHPPITLGWAPDEPDGFTFYRYRTALSIGNARLCEPIVFSGPNFSVNGYRGSFRFWNERRFNGYVNGRLYDPRFFAPDDEAALAYVEPFFDLPYECVRPGVVPGVGELPGFPTYALSAASMFDPQVMERRRLEGSELVGGWTDPWTRDTGFRSPSRSQARYPHLKTFMLELHWVRDRPVDPCVPGFEGPYGGCSPRLFNQGAGAAPATVFHDGSTRLLPNTEVIRADAILRKQGEGVEGLWSRTTPWGGDGYLGDLSIDGTKVSHHVLTADGILGRDTLDPSALDADPRSLPAALSRRESAFPRHRPDPRVPGIASLLQAGEDAP